MSENLKICFLMKVKPLISRSSYQSALTFIGLIEHFRTKRVPRTINESELILLVMDKHIVRIFKNIIVKYMYD